jgi:hypothetical protein
VILYTIFSVNRWLSERLSIYGSIAFMEAQDLPLPGFQVVWGEERELPVQPRGALSGARFSIYCAAPGGQWHVARRMAMMALSALRDAGNGFTIPRYRYPFVPGDEPIGRIALRDISTRELHNPQHPELAIHIVHATALTFNPPAY